MMEKDALYVHHKKLMYDALSNRVRKLAHNTWLLVSDANHQPHYCYTVQYGVEPWSPGISMTRYELEWLVSSVPSVPNKIKGMMLMRYGTIACGICSTFVEVAKVVPTPCLTTGSVPNYKLTLLHTTIDMLRGATLEIATSLADKERLNSSYPNFNPLNVVGLRMLMIGLAKRVNMLLYPFCTMCKDHDGSHTCGIRNSDIAREHALTALEYVNIDLLQSVLNANKMWCPVRLMDDVAPSNIRFSMSADVFNREECPFVTALLKNYEQLRPPCDEIDPPHYSSCWAVKNYANGNK